MKFALIFAEKSIPNIISQKCIDGLRELGEVVLNEGDASYENLKKTIKDADVAITSWGSPALTEELLDCAPNLKLVIHAAGSVKPIVTDAMWERGIRIVSSAKALGEGVAETALGFSISASKNFYFLNSNIHAGGYKEGYSNIKELVDITVGVVGCGWAGKHYIKLMSNFGVEIIAYDPYVNAETLEALGAKKTELEDVLKNSDILSIHAPNIPETHHMFNAETLAMMKKDAVLINTARGAIIDEKALYEHMAAGNLKYACLDVYDPEPILPENPLRTLPNCIMTPHLAGLTNNGKLKLGKHALYIAKQYVNGEKLDCEVTKDMLATMA